MKENIVIRGVSSPEEYPLILALAREIWADTYRDILSPEQIEYMMKMMYSPEVIDRERRENIVFEIVCDGTLPIGFISYGPGGGEGVIKLHKLYLSPAYHGRGIGSAMLTHAKAAARRAGGETLLLNVNKNNHRAIKAYKRNGFTLLREEVNPIGGGFVMDDYVFSTGL